MSSSETHTEILTHLLDTGWIIRHLRGANAWTESMQRIGARHLAVSMVSVAELSEGIYRAQRPDLARQAVEVFLSDKAVLNLTPDICDRFGRERARLREANQLIGDMDLFIGATGLHYGLILLTTNPRHFARLHGLLIMSDPRQ